MFTLKQGENSFTKYFARVKRLCNDLSSMEPPCKCLCDDKLRAIANINRDIIIKFLNDLNSQYNLVRNQIFLMDPMSAMSKIYAMLFTN